MSDLGEIAKNPGYDAAASRASKAAIFVFLATFVYLVFFSGASPGLLGGIVFAAVGIFVVSLTIAMPMFLVALKLPQLAGVATIVGVLLTVFLTRFAYLSIFTPSAQGVYLILELDNSRNVNQYTVFNPHVRSIAECNSGAAAAIPQILTSAPPNVPRDSRVKSWRCSLIPPEKGG